MKFYISTFLLTALFMAGCSGAANNSSAPSNNVGNSNAKATPGTEKTENEGDFVPSETGTAKATPEAGKANVQGKVVFNGEPVSGVEVKLCQKFSRFMGECSGESFKTKTDASGEYLIANVTAGIYEGLLVKVFETNSWVFATQKFGITSAKYKIDADSTYFAPLTNLFKSDMKLTEPKNGSSVAGTDLKVKWEAYQGAAYYKLSVSPENYDADSSLTNERVEGSEFTIPKTLKAGKYSLSLTAYNSNDIKLSELKDRVSFTVK
jgi:hypothetical protein